MDDKADRAYWEGAIIPILEKGGITVNYDTTKLLASDILNASRVLDKLKKETENKTFDFEKLALAQAVIGGHIDLEMIGAELMTIDCNLCKVEIKVDISQIEDGTLINAELVNRFNLNHKSGCPILIAKKVIQEFSNV